MGGVSDDVDGLGRELDAVGLPGALLGEGAEEVAVEGVVGEGADGVGGEGEVIEDAVVLELDPGAAAEVAGEEAYGYLREAGQGVEELGEAGEEAAIIGGQLGAEVREVGIEEEVDVFLCGLDAMGFEDAVGDPDVGLSGNLDAAQILIAPETVAQGADERFFSSATGVEDGLVDIEKEELHGKKFEIRMPKSETNSNFERKEMQLARTRSERPGVKHSRVRCRIIRI
jgi:hypothetical protein